jgi:hypothetical protein
MVAHFLRNIGHFLPDYTTSHLKRQQYIKPKNKNVTHSNSTPSVDVFPPHENMHIILDAKHHVLRRHKRTETLFYEPFFSFVFFRFVCPLLLSYNSTFHFLFFFLSFRFLSFSFIPPPAFLILLFVLLHLPSLLLHSSLSISFIYLSPFDPHVCVQCLQMLRSCDVDLLACVTANHSVCPSKSFPLAAQGKTTSHLVALDADPLHCVTGLSLSASRNSMWTLDRRETHSSLKGISMTARWRDRPLASAMENASLRPWLHLTSLSRTIKALGHNNSLQCRKVNLSLVKKCKDIPVTVRGGP